MKDKWRDEMMFAGWVRVYSSMAIAYQHIPTGKTLDSEDIQKWIQASIEAGRPLTPPPF